MTTLYLNQSTPYHTTPLLHNKCYKCSGHVVDCIAIASTNYTLRCTSSTSNLMPGSGKSIHFATESLVNWVRIFTSPNNWSPFYWLRLSEKPILIQSDEIIFCHIHYLYFIHYTKYIIQRCQIICKDATSRFIPLAILFYVYILRVNENIYLQPFFRSHS